MARRLCFEERVRIEAMTAAGVSAAEAARLMGRPSCDGAARAQAQRRPGPARPKAPKLARDAELAAAVCERLALRWSPQAIQRRSADPGPAGMLRDHLPGVL